MGWETLVLAGVTAYKAYSDIQEGNARANAAVEQGKQEAQNAANTTVMNAGRVRNSFLSSGLSLEGGPLAALNQIFNTGSTNISRIAANANAASKNSINAARSAALSTIAMTAATAGSGSLFGSTSSTTSLAGNAGVRTASDFGGWDYAMDSNPYSNSLGAWQ